MSDHDVVLYGEDHAALTHCVVPFIAAALQDGGAAVVIASGDHERAFRGALETVALHASSDAMRERLTFLDANETLRRIVVNGNLDRVRFKHVVGNVLRRLGERFTVHAYGEMVGILRASQRAEVAHQVECLWSELLAEIPFRLLCGYPIDVLGAEFAPDEMQSILTTHATLVSVLPDIAASLDAGIEATFGSRRASVIRGMIEATRRPGWATVGDAERTLIWLRENLPSHADDVIRHARISSMSYAMEAEEEDPPQSASA